MLYREVRNLPKKLNGVAIFIKAITGGVSEKV